MSGPSCVPRKHAPAVPARVPYFTLTLDFD